MSTPLEFESITIRNFLSFGNQSTTIDLTYFGSTFIRGQNIDANSDNGAGKTSIINALCYAIYNKPFDNISLQRLINSTNSIKNTLMEVTLNFKKGGDRYEIYRCRGESVNVKITLNGNSITLDSIDENDRLIEEIIGMSYELFTRTVIFSGNSIPFLMLPISSQRQQFEELFIITLLTEKALNLKKIIKSTEENIAIQQAVSKEQETQLALYTKQLKDAEQRVLKWEDDRLKQIKTIEDQLEAVKHIDMNQEKELHSLVNDLIKHEKDLLNQQSILKKDKIALSSDVKKLRDELDHLMKDKCPYCLQKYAGASEKLVEKQELLEVKTEKLQSTEEKITNLEAEITELVNQRYEADKIMKFASLAEAIKAETAATTAQQKIDDLKNSENPHVEAFDQLTQNAVKKVSYEKLDELKKDLEHQQFLLKLLTDKNSFIRKNIINKTIPFLNNRLIAYTKELGLPHIVKFDSDMSCSVTQYGRELDFGNLSSGEKKRVNLSLSLAFRDVLHHLHSRVNCLFIDEIDASLDPTGVNDVFKLLKTKVRDDKMNLWIISHRPEAVGRFDRTITIRKENGFSRILADGDDE